MNKPYKFKQSLGRFTAICLLLLTLAAGVISASADPCELQIESAGPCLADGTPATPAVGEGGYGLRVRFKVTGTPAHPFRVRFALANQTYDTSYLTAADSEVEGSVTWQIGLDDTIPWSITLDPDRVSGDADILDHTAGGSFIPTPPPVPVELYAPLVLEVSETYGISFQPGGGILPQLNLGFSHPTSHGPQIVIRAPDPSRLDRKNAPATSYQDTSKFAVKLSNMRVNPGLLRIVTSADLDAMTDEWKKWTAPDPDSESADPAIAAFVQQSLPPNFRASLTPYDTARTLHRAVARALTYLKEPPHNDAVHVLKDKVANCAGFSALLTACLRDVGIPARTIGGFWEGMTVLHARTEFHLPGVEWLMADATGSNGEDPTGTYAYDFGFIPDGNTFVCLDSGRRHDPPAGNLTAAEEGYSWTSLNGAAQMRSGSYRFTAHTMSPQTRLPSSPQSSSPAYSRGFSSATGAPSDIDDAYHGTTETNFTRNSVVVDGRKIDGIVVANPAPRARVALVDSDGGIDVAADKLPQGFLDLWGLTPAKLKGANSPGL